MQPVNRKVQASQAKLESLGEGRFRISGVLDADTATAILDQSASMFGATPRILIDFSAVTASDSAGLALLLEWLRHARADSRQIHYDNVPQQIMALARISEVDDLLLENGAIDTADMAIAESEAAALG